MTTLVTYKSSSHPTVRNASQLERRLAMALKTQAAGFANSSREQGFGHCHYRVQDLRTRALSLIDLQLEGEGYFKIRPDVLADLTGLWLREDGFVVNYRKIDIAVEGGYRYNFWIRW